MTTTQNLTLDLVKFQEAIRKVINGDFPKDIDGYTWAARESSGIPDLVLTTEQRISLKSQGLAMMYNMGSTRFLKAFTTDTIKQVTQS